MPRRMDSPPPCSKQTLPAAHDSFGPDGEEDRRPPAAVFRAGRRTEAYRACRKSIPGQEYRRPACEIPGNHV